MGDSSDKIYLHPLLIFTFSLKKNMALCAMSFQSNVTKKYFFDIWNLEFTILGVLMTKISASKKNMVVAKIVVENNLNIFRKNSI